MDRRALRADSFETIVASAGSDAPQRKVMKRDGNENRATGAGTPATELTGRGAKGSRPLKPCATSASHEELTARQREVLRLVAEGHASKQIADELKISVNTANNHRSAVYRKLRVHSATAAARLYWGGGYE